MDDLIAFLSARLDEDEAVAQAAGGRTWQQGDPGRTPGWIQDDSGSIDSIVVYDEGAPTGEQAAHIARHDPARVLREVAGKREMLTELTTPPFDYRPECNDSIRRFVRLLALPYADHPEYQPGWKP